METRNNNKQINNFIKNSCSSVLVNIEIIRCYTTEIVKFNGIKVKLINNTTISLNDLFKELGNNALDLKTTGNSYYDCDLKTFIFCGYYPFSNCVTISNPNKFNNLENPKIILRSRQVIEKDNFMRSECNEENRDKIDIIKMLILIKKVKDLMKEILD
jgi:hypothetical protein